MEDIRRDRASGELDLHEARTLVDDSGSAEPFWPERGRRWARERRGAPARRLPRVEPAGSLLTATREEEEPPTDLFDTAEVPTPGRTRGPAVVLPHLRALDGLRGLAVGGVLLYHGGALTGGYLGVDLFFVLSGFLITTLLLRDAAEHGRVPLRTFWERRARRLLPAIGGLLIGVAVYALVWAPPGDGTELRAEALATIGYVANWYAVATGAGYWDAFQAPSPLRHMWSLGIEEQFYLVWPLVVALLAAVARLLRFRAALAVGAVAAAGAVASYAWMAVSYVPDADPSRVYYGTDTRAGAILLGAVLACVLVAAGRWVRPRVVATSAPGPEREARPPVPLVLRLAALVSVAALAVGWVVLDGRSPLLYRGGFAAAGVAAVLVIAVAVHPGRSLLTRLLSLAPLRWLGLISYGLYLWHWPVFVVLQSERLRLGLDDGQLLAAKLGMSVVLAVVSYLVLERPIRRHGLAAWRPASGRARRRLVPAAGIGAVLVVLAATTVAAVWKPGDGSGVTASEAVAMQADPAPVAHPGPGTTVPSPDGARRATGPLPWPAGRAPRVMVVGDSVGFDVGSALDLEKSTGVLALNRAIPACTLGRTASEWRHRGITGEPEHPRCRQWDRTWPEALDRFHPDAVVLAFAGPPSDELRLDGQWRPVCGPEVARYWRAEVDAAIRVLSSRGAVVFLTAPAPHRSPYFNDADNEHLACLGRVYREAAKAHPGTTRLLRLDEWVCPGGRCHDEVEGVKLRHDGVHFIDGARPVLARWVAAQVFAAPPT
jgi:peptidoglycan/LPS O-acetylase OafA/YrhL